MHTGSVKSGWLSDEVKREEGLRPQPQDKQRRLAIGPKERWAVRRVQGKEAREEEECSWLG